jgi:hypothetical protein
MAFAEVRAVFLEPARFAVTRSTASGARRCRAAARIYSTLGAGARARHIRVDYRPPVTRRRYARRRTGANPKRVRQRIACIFFEKGLTRTTRPEDVSTSEHSLKSTAPCEGETRGESFIRLDNRVPFSVRCRGSDRGSWTDGRPPRWP